jgi:RNA polymerase sigma-70 factor (ECF subfamily)
MEKEFLKLIYDYQKIIYRVCKPYRDSREDQERFNFKKYCLSHSGSPYPSFKGESKISSWMYRIALEYCNGCLSEKLKLPG